MNKNSIGIDIIKQFVDNDTLIKIATLEAEKRADTFKYTLNIIKDRKYPNKVYQQLKGTIGYDKKTKLFVSHYLGPLINPTTIDKSTICLKYSALMKTKAKNIILKELLK